MSDHRKLWVINQQILDHFFMILDNVNLMFQTFFVVILITYFCITLYNAIILVIFTVYSKKYDT